MNDLDYEIYAETLFNAIEHNGKASTQAVLGKILAKHQELRSKVKEILKIVEQFTIKVNSLSYEEQKIELEKYKSYLSIKQKPQEEKDLPDIPNRPERVVTRFAPNPDGPLHIGNLRAAVLSYKYAKKYGGKFILRFEDTDPKIKPPLLKAYDWIQEDLKWLGLEWDELYIQSDRLELYYEYARRLIANDDAYVCECTQEVFKNYKNSGLACPHRDRKDSLVLFEKMIAGNIEEGKAVLRLKTSMHESNPALRDPPLMRVIDTRKNPHPRIGSKYYVFPLYNFSAALDDSLMGVTLIFRGKEHLTNSLIQTEIQKKLGLSTPFSIQYGRLKLEGYILSKSKIRSTILSGQLIDFPSFCDGWDDPRLATLMALRRRGFQPKALIDLIIDVGFKPSEATISWDNLATLNRRVVEPKANRLFLTLDPVKLVVRNVPKELSEIVELPLHPSYPAMGFRKIKLKIIENTIDVYISGSDALSLKPGDKLRLMELFNIKIFGKDHEKLIADYESKSIEELGGQRVPIFQWVPANDSVRATLFIANGMNLYVKKGFIESSVRLIEKGSVVQLVRIGYARLDELSEEANLIFTHD